MVESASLSATGVSAATPPAARPTDAACPAYTLSRAERRAPAGSTPEATLPPSGSYFVDVDNPGDLFVAAGVAPDSRAYRTLNGEQRRERLWDFLSRRPYEDPSRPGGPGVMPRAGQGSLADDAIGGIGKIVGGAFARLTENRGDVHADRTKVLHTHGVVAKVRLDILDPRYTGILRSGAAGIARLSLAGTHDNFAPGMAIKFFIDDPQPTRVTQSPSFGVNIRRVDAGRGSDTLDGHFNGPLDPTTNQNYLDTQLSNVLQPSENFGTQVLTAFTGLFADPLRRPVDNFAARDSAGQVEANPRAPYQIVFVQPPDAPELSSAGGHDFRRDLMTLEPGRVLYQMWARASADAPLELIGELRTESPFVASPAADRRLMFTHAK